MKQYLDLGSLFMNKGMPTYIVYHITSICNARCKMCFNWKNMNKDEAKKELKLDEIARFSKSLRKLIYVSLGGGEPFLRKDIDDICYVFYKNNKTRIFQIATNSLQPEKTAKKVELILKKCPKAILKITLSLDGIGKDHDEVRGVPGNFEKFKETYNLLAEIRERYPHLEILSNTTYSKYTEEKVQKIYEWVRDNIDVDMHSFTYVRGETKEEEAKQVSVDNYEKFVQYVEEEYRKKRFRKGRFKKIFPVLSMLTRRHVIRELRGKDRTFKCLAGKRLLHIDPFGNIFACEYMPGMVLGNIKENDYDIKKILELPKTKKTLKFIKDKKCNCTWECAIKQSIVYDIKTWPTVLKEILKLK